MVSEESKYDFLICFREFAFKAFIVEVCCMKLHSKIFMEL